MNPTTSIKNPAQSRDQKCPLVRPADPQPKSASAEVNAQGPESSATNTPLVPAVNNAAGRRVIGKVVRAGLRARLQERDHAILGLFGTHRYLTTHLIQGFCFPETADLRLESAARQPAGL